MLKQFTISSLIKTILLSCLLSANMAYSQTCGSVSASDITTTAAACPGNGSITGPTLASGSVYELSGGDITGVIQQNNRVFSSLSAGTYTLKILCSGEPAVSFPVTVANKHSSLGLSLTGTMACPGAGTINATATGGFNQGGVGINYQYTMWPSSAGGANRADGALTYSAASSWTSQAEGDYFVRVKDNCGNIFTQSIQLKPSKPVGKVSLGVPNIVCSGGNLTFSFPNAELQDASGMPISNFTAPYYQYRVEEVTLGGSCDGATTIGAPIIPNTNITLSTDLSSLSINTVSGKRYRVVVTSPCGGETTSDCFSSNNLITLDAITSRLCAPVGTANIRTPIIVNSADGYTITYPGSLTIVGSGGYNQTIPVPDQLTLYSLGANIPEAAFPITATFTDNCGNSAMDVQVAPPSGTGPTPISFTYDYSCVQTNGMVSISTYLTGNWFGLEYYTGDQVDKTKFELINATTNVVVSTLYGLSNGLTNNLVFQDVPAGAVYFVRVTPPASVVGAGCPVQDSNPIEVPAEQGQLFTVTPTVEKICNNGLNNIIYNVSTNTGGKLTYSLHQGTISGVVVSTSATPNDLPAGTYYYVITRPSTVVTCATPVTREGTIVIDAWQTNPIIARTLAVNCQPLGSGPQTTGQALLQFSGYGPFSVERSTDNVNYTVVQVAAVDQYLDNSLTNDVTYYYRITDQCGKSVSQQVAIKPLSPRLVSNTAQPCVNSPYTLSAIDFGDPDTEYKWEKVGTPGVLATTREYTFPNYTAANDGTYKLTVTLLNGCVVRETLITLNSTDCGNPFATGSIGDRVWFDTNKNGVQNAAETGVAGVTVNLEAYVGPASPTPTDLTNPLNWAPSATTVTDANGNYLFSGLETGYYRVQFVEPNLIDFTTYHTAANTANDSDAGANGYSQPVLIDALGTGIAKDNLTIDAGLIDQPLPVKLTSFDVKKGENGSAALRWKTVEEVNSSYFEVQRSADAKVWTAIGEVKANVNSKSSVNYYFDDMQPNLGTNYYRLKMVDIDGSYAMSTIRQLAGDFAGADLMLYPNPVSNELSIKGTTGKAITKMELLNQSGRVVLSRNAEGALLPINVKTISAGVYVVKISFANGSVENRKVIIAH